MSLLYHIAYRIGFRPWEKRAVYRGGATDDAAAHTSSPPPELEALVEGPDALPPRRALDLGCGAGIDSTYLAAHGWEVTGIESEHRAIEDARARSRAAGVSPRFIEGDVTRMSDLDIGDGFTLILDIGCFHTLPRRSRGAYVRQIGAAASPDATLLLFAFGGIPGTAPKEEVAARFGPAWEIESHEQSNVPRIFRPMWYQMHRRA